MLRRMGGTEARLLEGADGLGMSARPWAVEGDTLCLSAFPGTLGYPAV